MPRDWTHLIYPHYTRQQAIEHLCRVNMCVHYFSGSWRYKTPEEMTRSLASLIQTDWRDYGFALVKP